MNIGAMGGQQGQGLNISAINRKAAQNHEAIYGKKKDEERKDIAIISPEGKKQSLIEQLMNQKQELVKQKESLLASAAESGANVKEQIDTCDQKIEEIDQQITQLQSQVTAGEKSKDNEAEDTDKPRTKEEIQRESINQLTDLSTGSRQMDVIASVRDKLDGRIEVLKAEAASGYGDVEGKLEEVSQLEKRSRELDKGLSQRLQETNDAIEDKNAEAAKALSEVEENGRDAQREQDEPLTLADN